MLLPGLLIFLIASIIQHQNQKMSPLLRTLEGLRAKSEEVSLDRARILREISHDVRTPLSGALGAVDLLLSAPHDPEDRKWLEVIRTSIARVRDTLDEKIPGIVRTTSPETALPRRLTGRILVVEDHPVTLIVLERMLQHLGLEAVTTASLQQARRALLDPRGFSAVLMDLDLPDGDGRDLCTEIRRTNADLPVLAVTAAVLNEERASCLAVGMNDFLAKPVSLLSLEAKLREHIKTHA